MFHGIANLNPAENLKKEWFDIEIKPKMNLIMEIRKMEGMEIEVPKQEVVEEGKRKVYRDVEDENGNIVTQWAAVTQVNLSNFMDMHRQQVNNWVHGRGTPRLKDAILLAMVLECHVEDLFEIKILSREETEKRRKENRKKGDKKGDSE